MVVLILFLKSYYTFQHLIPVSSVISIVFFPLQQSDLPCCPFPISSWWNSNTGPFYCLSLPLLHDGYGTTLMRNHTNTEINMCILCSHRCQMTIAHLLYLVTNSLVIDNKGLSDGCTFHIITKRNTRYIMKDTTILYVKTIVMVVIVSVDFPYHTFEIGLVLCVVYNNSFLSITKYAHLW